MGNRAWKYWVIASILAVALWPADSRAAEEKAQPRDFNSGVAFSVYAVVGEQPQFVGTTPSEQAPTPADCTLRQGQGPKPGRAGRTAWHKDGAPER
jgi:hypothetical protein